MGFIEALIRALIYIGFVVLAFVLCLWFLGEIGLQIPLMAVRILWAILVLVCILVLIRLFGPWAGGFSLFPPKQ